MMTFVIIYGGITLFVGVIVLLDWLGRRQDRRRQTHHRSA